MKDKTVTDTPYKVEQDPSYKGCPHCGSGNMWMVVGPDDCALSVFYADKNVAEELAERMNEAYSKGRADSAVDKREQMTLGDLLNALISLPDNLHVTVDIDGKSPTKLASYRGYYNHLAIGTGGRETVTVADLQGTVAAARGRSFEGYKGGTYTAGRETPIWLSNWGDVSGMQLVDVTIRNGVVVLVSQRNRD